MTKTIVDNVSISYVDISTKDSGGKEFLPGTMEISYGIFADHGTESRGTVKIPVPSEVLQILESTLKEALKNISQ